VAVAAIDSVVADVVLVTERNRLTGRHIHIGGERPCVDLVGGQDDGADHQQNSHDADFRQAVRTSMEDLRHAQQTQLLTRNGLARKCACCSTTSHTNRASINTASRTGFATSRTRQICFVAGSPYRTKQGTIQNGSPHGYRSGLGKDVSFERPKSAVLVFRTSKPHAVARQHKAQNEMPFFEAMKPRCSIVSGLLTPVIDLNAAAAVTH